jgi:TonB family protein
MAGNPQTRTVSENPQARRLLLALILLLVALVGVVLKDQQFWFGSDHSTLDSDGPTATVATKAVATPVPATAASKSASVSAAKKHLSARQSVVQPSTEPKPSDAPAVTTNRTVLPPLEVEVVAGDNHSRVRPGSNATKVELTRPEAAAPMAPATNAAEHAALSIEAIRPPATYPILAQHMNVQGSVVLQAVIGTDGMIQNLHVVTGPSILATAAQQAVREWRFKPVVQNGQPVETQAKITVNFTIKVADGTPKATVAENHSDRNEVVSR